MSRGIAKAAAIVGAVIAIAAAIPTGGTSLLALGLGVSAGTASAIALGVTLAVSIGTSLTANKPPGATATFTPYRPECPL